MSAPPGKEKSAEEEALIKAERDRKKAEKAAKKAAGAKRTGTDLKPTGGSDEKAAAVEAKKKAAEEKEAAEVAAAAAMSTEELYNKIMVGVITEVAAVDGKPNIKKCSIAFSEDSGAPVVSVITNAKNITEGHRVPVATEGAKIGSLAITKTVVYGVESEGMLCDSAALFWKGKANCPPAGQAVVLDASFPLGSLPPRDPPMASTTPAAVSEHTKQKGAATEPHAEKNEEPKKPSGGARAETEEERLKREAKKAEKAAIKAAKAKGLPPPPKTGSLNPAALGPTAAASSATGAAVNTPPNQGNLSSPGVAKRRQSTSEAGMFPENEQLQKNASFSGAALGVVSPSGVPPRSPPVTSQKKSKPPLPTAVGEPLPSADSNEQSQQALIARQKEEEARLNNPLLNPRKPLFAMETEKMKAIHPRFAELGVMFRGYQLVGSNARCIALLEALEQLVVDSTVLQQGTGSLDARCATELIKQVDANLEWLHLCREVCIGMKYIVERFKSTILHHAMHNNNNSDNNGDADESGLIITSEKSTPAGGLPTVASTASLSTVMSTAHHGGAASPSSTGRNPTHKKTLSPVEFVTEVIDELRDSIWSGLHSIVRDIAPQHIHDGDVILTYGRSSSVEALLKEAKTEKGKRFSVVVIDSAPLFEGRGLTTRLQQVGISVTYGLLSSVCLLAPKCTKAIFGSSAVLQSGDVVSRSGTAMAALVMKKERKPVLFLSELYKLTTSVWLLSLTINEDTRTLNDRVRSKNGEQQPIPRYAYGTYVPRRPGALPGGLADDTSSLGGGDQPPQSPTAARPFFWNQAASPRGAATPTSRVDPTANPMPLPTDRPETPAPSGKSVSPLPFGTGLGEDASSGCSSNAPRGAIADDGYLYDITPRSCIDMVVTEIGPLHPTAIASAVRERDEREKGKLSSGSSKSNVTAPWNTLSGVSGRLSN